MLYFHKSLLRFLIATLVLSLLNTTAYAATAADQPPCKKMTLEQLRARYPNAKIIEVTPEEFERLKKQYGDEAVVLKDMPGQMRMDKSLFVKSGCVKKPGQPATRNSGQTSQQVSEPVTTDEPDSDTQVSAHVDLGLSGHLDSDDAVVVFVVVGVFVVAALFIGVGIIAYDMMVNHRKYTPWYDLALAESPVISDSGGQDQIYDWANLVGLRFSTGLQRSNFGVGLTFDAGYLHVGLNNRYDAGRSLRQDGAYAMLGPQVRLALGGDMNDAYFYGELLAGRTTLDEVDLVSAARIGFRGRVWSNSVCDHCFLGANLGSLYLGLKPRDGLLLKNGSRNDEFLLFLGLEFGYQF